MKIQRIYVEKVDSIKGQVIPRVKTFSDGEFLGRHLPITNRVAYIENTLIF